ncbi:unnamed protein product [Echinostoma caproni]|uniref:Ubiquitin-related modifier 1 homolog n=1 Tax=Echinostoma caproni TaxID=27848 RepID=A0A183B5H9_9TREM|nr:unnamed protein product [Echinostoma caproni]
MKICVEFSGGAEILFGKVKEHTLELPASIINLQDLLAWLKENLLEERPELFLQGKSIRPGILVLINDTDYSLLGENDYILQENDRISFISSLHGG